MSAESFKEKGNEYFKKGDYERAIENYTYATEMDPKNHIYYTNRSLCYSSMKKWEKSLRDADKAISLKSDWEKGWYRRGIALFNMNNYEDAMKAFERCTEINPTSADYKNQYDLSKKEFYKGLSESEILKIDGNDLFKKGKIPEAIARYTLALEKAKGDDDKTKATRADIYANRAACNVQLYDPVKVRDDCNAALALVPNHVKALLRRGQALESLEKYKDALADFELALRWDPNNSMALQALTRIKRALAAM
jgi:tetratricopeptide (TPR) repeat protein